MRLGDAQLGSPQILYVGITSEIESIPGLTEGAIAYASDTSLFGVFNGTSWSWGSGGGSSLTIVDAAGTPSVAGVSTITVSGLDLTDLGGGNALLSVDKTWKHWARAVTTTGLPAHTYNNSLGTITANAAGTLVIEGLTIALNDYILVVNDTFKNGLYKCTTQGTVSVPFVLTRSTDMNKPEEFPGAMIPVGIEAGYGSPVIYQCYNTSVTLGVTSILFTLLRAFPVGIAGGALTGQYPTPSLAAGIDATKIGAGTVDNTEFGYLNGATSNLQSQINLKLDSNTPITGATKTKITYDSDGLVTAGSDATTADIADSTDKRYVTEEDLLLVRGYSRIFMIMGA